MSLSNALASVTSTRTRISTHILCSSTSINTIFSAISISKSISISNSNSNSNFNFSVDNIKNLNLSFISRRTALSTSSNSTPTRSYSFIPSSARCVHRSPITRLSIVPVSHLKSKPSFVSSTSIFTSTSSSLRDCNSANPRHFHSGSKFPSSTSSSFTRLSSFVLMTAAVSGVAALYQRDVLSFSDLLSRFRSQPLLSGGSGSGSDTSREERPTSTSLIDSISPPSASSSTYAFSWNPFSSSSGSSSPTSFQAGGCSSPVSLSTPPPPVIQPIKNRLYTDAEILAQISVEEKIIPVMRGKIKEYHSNWYAANPSIEDSFTADIKLIAANGALFTIHDGHSGSGTSYFCRTELNPYLQYYFQSKWTPTLLHPLPFIDADNHFLTFSYADGNYAAGLSGACINAVHIDGDHITVANAGDCRAVIGRRLRRKDGTLVVKSNNVTTSVATRVDESETKQAPVSPSSSASSSSSSIGPYIAGSGSPLGRLEWSAIDLSTDHQINNNPSERDRLLREHIDEEDIIKRNRVKGRLQPTRGMGDGTYKRIEYFKQKPVAMRSTYTSWNPPYTTAEPELTEHQLEKNDEFLILSTDGLYQDLTSQQVVEYVGEWIDKIKETNNNHHNQHTSKSNETFRNVSSYLISKSLIAASENFMGRRRPFPYANLSTILSMPHSQRRNVHDDLTILVIFFEHEKKLESDKKEEKDGKGVIAPPTLVRAQEAVRRVEQQQQQQGAVSDSSGGSGGGAGGSGGRTVQQKWRSML